MKFVYVTMSIVTIILILLPICANSSKGYGRKSEDVNTKNKHRCKELQISDKWSNEVIVHGFLHWASMGFLIPVGILVIRISNREQSGKRLRFLFYLHATFQMLAVLITTAGAIMSFKYFENSFTNAHRRLGLTLYGVVWLQALTGVWRPKRGSRGRRAWYVGHWVLGTTLSLLGMVNVYTGLQAYNKRTCKSISFWNVLFTIQICIIAFWYLFQDKWAYIQNQGVVLGQEPVQPSDKPNKSFVNSC